MPSVGLMHMGPRDHMLDGGRHWTNPFASARDDKLAMQPFTILLWTLVMIINKVAIPHSDGTVHG